MTEKEGIFVLKDNDDNYVGSNSISYDTRNKRYIYSYSKFYTNGFYTYSNESDAMKGLEFLQLKSINIKIGIKFHVEEINRYETLKRESKMDIPRDPFQHEYFRERMAIA